MSIWEVVDEVVLWQPGESFVVDELVGQCRSRRSLRQQPAERLALVEPEGRDVDQTDDVRCVGAKRGHDLPAVGMAGDDGRSVLECQHLAKPGDVICQRREGKLGGRDVVAVGLQALDDRAPTGTVRPGTVNENDVRSTVHFIL